MRGPVQPDEAGCGARFFNRTLVIKIFECLEAFIVGDYGVSRCYFHSENDFVLAREMGPLQLVIT